MKVYYELDLRFFTFWAGAKQTVEYLSNGELEELNNIFEDMFTELHETEINDIFWFESDWIAELLGYEDFEELMLKKKLDTIKLTKDPYTQEYTKEI